jgi:hypothetical protein
MLVQTASSDLLMLMLVQTTASDLLFLLLQCVPVLNAT